MKILQGNIRVGKKHSSRDAKGCPDQFEHLPTKFNATMKLGKSWGWQDIQVIPRLLVPYRQQ